MASVRFRDGTATRGFLRNESAFEVAIQDSGGRLRSFARDRVASIERDTLSPMPALNATAREQRDLLAYLTRLAGAPGKGKGGWTATNPSFDDLVNPKLGEWPMYHGSLS